MDDDRDIIWFEDWQESETEKLQELIADYD
jgi:hypothetical protein